MRTLTLTLRETDKHGETFSSTVKVELKGESIQTILMGAYLKAQHDIEKYQLQSEIAEQEMKIKRPSV